MGVELLFYSVEFGSQSSCQQTPRELETRCGREGHPRPRGPSENPRWSGPQYQENKTQRDGHNSGVKIWSLRSVSSILSHANLSKPCNKVRGEYFSKEVFMRFPSCVLYSCVCYHCVGMYPVYIYVFLHGNQQMTMQYWFIWTIFLWLFHSTGSGWTSVEFVFNHLDLKIKNRNISQIEPHAITIDGVFSWCNDESDGLRVRTLVVLLYSLSSKYPWERYESPYPPSYGLNSSTTILLGEWLWH